MARIALKVAASAATSGVTGWLGEALKVRVRAPAERGKANAEVEKVLADALAVSRSDVAIVSGFTSGRKTLEVAGLSMREIRDRIDRLLQEDRAELP